MLGLERTAVQRWTYQPPRGLGDKVPMRHWTALVEKSSGSVSLGELMNAEVGEIVAAANEQAA